MTAPGQAILTLTRDAAKELDRVASADYGIPSLLLMENAAHAVAAAARALASPGLNALVVCGPGNNGGDGLAAARHLHNAGLRVVILLCAQPGKIAGDARTNLSIVERMALPLRAAPGPAGPHAFGECTKLLAGRKPDVIVDALFGTGLSRPLDEHDGMVVERIAGARADGARVLAVDIPSGLDADTGKPLGVAVRADVTVTFGAWKAGFAARSAPEFTGRIEVGDLGVPRELVARLARPVSVD